MIIRTSEIAFFIFPSFLAVAAVLVDNLQDGEAERPGSVLGLSFFEILDRDGLADDGRGILGPFQPLFLGKTGTDLDLVSAVGDHQGLDDVVENHLSLARFSVGDVPADHIFHRVFRVLHVLDLEKFLGATGEIGCVLAEHQPFPATLLHFFLPPEELFFRGHPFLLEGTNKDPVELAVGDGLVARGEDRGLHRAPELFEGEEVEDVVGRVLHRVILLPDFRDHPLEVLVPLIVHEADFPVEIEDAFGFRELGEDGFDQLGEGGELLVLPREELHFPSFAVDFRDTPATVQLAAHEPRPVEDVETFLVLQLGGERDFELVVEAEFLDHRVGDPEFEVVIEDGQENLLAVRLESGEDLFDRGDGGVPGNLPRLEIIQSGLGVGVEDFDDVVLTASGDGDVGGANVIAVLRVGVGEDPLEPVGHVGVNNLGLLGVTGGVLDGFEEFLGVHRLASVVVLGLSAYNITTFWSNGTDYLHYFQIVKTSIKL